MSCASLLAGAAPHLYRARKTARAANPRRHGNSMQWFFLALVTALTQAVKDTFLKSAMTRTDPPWPCCSTAPWRPSCCGRSPAASPDTVVVAAFWPLLVLGGALGGVTYCLYGLALKRGDLSLTLPMLAFTPLFLLITSPLTLGEFPRPGGLVALPWWSSEPTCLICGNGATACSGRSKPLVTNAGSRLMLLVAAILEHRGNIDKLGLQASSPPCGRPASTPPPPWRSFPLPLGACAVRARAAGFPRAICLAGALEAAGLFCQMHALPLTQVSYVIAVKRLSIIFGVLLGAMVFREPDLAHRLPGAAVMVAGVFFIVIFG